MEIMRRLVVEFPRENLKRIGGPDPFQNIKSIEILHYLRQDKNEFSLLCRIVLKDPKRESIEQVLSRNENVIPQILGGE